MAAMKHMPTSPSGRGAGGGLDEKLLDDLRIVALANQWPFEALGITDTDVLIAESALVEMLEGAKGARKTRIVNPDGFKPEDGSDNRRVFVMLLRGELAFVRELQRQHSERVFISVTYGARGSNVDLASFAAQGLELTTIISSPCSGAGHLLNLIKINKLANSETALTPAEVAWAKCQQDFDVVRCLTGKLFGKQGHVVVRLGLDLVDHLRGVGALRPEKFKSFAAALEARVIFMTRRNRADQIALMTTKGQANPPEPDAKTLVPVALDLIAAETRHEILFATLPIFRTISFEELSESPVEVMKMLGSFFEMKTLRNITVADPAAEELHASWKDSFRASYKQAIVEYLGLSKNKHGSYQTTTEKIRSQ